MAPLRKISLVFACAVLFACGGGDTTESAEQISEICSKAKEGTGGALRDLAPEQNPGESPLELLGTALTRAQASIEGARDESRSATGATDAETEALRGMSQVFDRMAGIAVQERQALSDAEQKGTPAALSELQTQLGGFDSQMQSAGAELDKLARGVGLDGCS